jgi:hypothetical protein
MYATSQDYHGRVEVFNKDFVRKRVALDYE